MVDFARSFIGLSDSVPAHSALAELGIYNFSIQAATTSLLLIHRLLSNPQDTLTPQLMHWTVNQRGGTQLDLAATHLTLLGSPVPLAELISMPYIFAKGLLHTAARSAQAAKWRHNILKTTPRSTIALASLHTWGPTKALLAAPPAAARSYIRARLEDGVLAFNADRPMCSHCPPGTIAGTVHYVAHCTATIPTRAALLASIHSYSPYTAHIIAHLGPVELASCLLGAGPAHFPPDVWSRVQSLAIPAVHSMCLAVTGPVAGPQAV